MAIPQLEILLPVHNEAETIAETIQEIYDVLSSKIRVGFIVCEDGSKDNTKEIVRQLSESLPIRLNLSDQRKGYSRAVREGMQMLEADYLLCLDSDGQCDPRDFWNFWEVRTGCDVLVGWRVRRADTLVRRSFSRFFYGLYQIVFRVPVHDPSCPYVLMKKTVAKDLCGELGAMQQGFWWEFVGRAHRHGYHIVELPVHHRQRSAGTTQVYRWHKMPTIFVHHVAALFRIWFETRSFRRMGQ